MRRSGLIEHTRALGAHDHVCWQYEKLPEFRQRAREFLAEGLELGHRVRYVASGEPDALMADLDAIRPTRSKRPRPVEVVSLESAYPAGATLDPDAQLGTNARETAAALADGFTGFRIAADCTPLVQRPEQVDRVARYEHLADRLMAAQPFSAICAYDRASLDEQTIAQLVCLHPKTNGQDPGFRLHASAAGATRLAGEIDLVNRDLFALALERARLEPSDGRVVVDAAELRFIDHRSLMCLSDHATRKDAVLVLRTRWSGAPLLADALSLPDVLVEKVR